MMQLTLLKQTRVFSLPSSVNKTRSIQTMVRFQKGKFSFIRPFPSSLVYSMSATHSRHEHETSDMSLTRTTRVQVRYE